MVDAPEWPTGTVTFAFSDIEGSTRLWAAHPDHMRVALATHDDVVAGAAAAFDGYVFSRAGDSFGVAFGRPAQAVEWALAVQERLAVQPWPGDVVIRTRIGMHTGESDERDGDYFGSAVNLAARIEAAGHGGQILTSAVTAALLDRDDLVRLGSFHLKDVAALQPIFQLGDAVHEPLRTLDSRRGNLPRQLNTLIGRADEINALTAQLRDNALTTLVGPGGIGKTRLATEAARHAEQTWPDGAWLVELSRITDPDDVARAVADAIGVRDTGGDSLADLVADHVEGQKMLLLLDNCEHVVDGVASLVSTLLRRHSEARVLATSRTGLGVQGEQLFAVMPLDADDAATELFAERARAVDADFDLARWNQPVAEICRRLDGLPLAIELAAARVRTLSPPDLAARLDDRFRLLTGGQRSQLEHHRTLRETVAWSFDLLDPDQQLVFARLSVFVGVFDVRAAEAVVTDERLDAIEVLDLLDDLVDRSMVTSTSGPFGRQFRILETLRQFGTEELAARRGTASARSRHATWFADEVSHLATDLAGQREIEGVARLDAMWDNIRAAHEWACREGDPELAASLFVPITMELFWRGRAEITRFAQRVLETPGAADSPLARRCAGVAAAGHRWAQDQSALDELDTKFGHLDRTVVDLHQAWLNGRWADAMALADQARIQADAHNDAYLARCFRFGTASALLRLGRHDEYIAEFEEAARIATTEGPPTILRLSLEGIAIATSMLGDFDEAAAMLTRAMAVETPEGTYTLVPFLGAPELFDRGGRAEALSMMADGVRTFIATDTIFYAWIVAASFASIMARLGRTTDVARAVGFFQAATRQIDDVKQLAAEGLAHLDEHATEEIVVDREAGSTMTPAEALDYMAGVLEAALQDTRR